ncbi:ankyrin repeat-containing protein [Anaeramoeba flamelloides]|uniref:Ankyrin repeat-containing protein n=1 Tax=Anaeramoeba flamelloides TaxID=1746091 RepID=A0AAV7ZZG5_9EUKA|nr:ankyrin repeat-containing protein [Anaeramoeba flamelloides]
MENIIFSPTYIKNNITTFTEEDLECLISCGLEEVQRLVSYGNVNQPIGNVDSLVCDEISIFHFLSKYNPKPEIIEYLLDIGGDVEKRDCYGNTPLSIACSNRGLQLLSVDYFVRAGSELNATNKFNSTALHHICSSEKPDPNLIDFLVKNGANVNSVDVLGGTPLDYILSRKVLNFPIIQYLIENGILQKQKQKQQENEKEKEKEKEKEIVRKKDLTNHVQTNTHYQNENSKQNTTKNKDINMNENENENEDENENLNENVNENVNENENLNKRKKHLCICENEALSLELINQLISKKDIIQSKQSLENILLNFFSRHNHINFKIIAYLVELGANLHTINDYHSPLLYCCKQKKIDSKTISFLIQNGCRTNVCSNVDHSTPLHLLCSHKDVTPQIISLVIQSGAKVNNLNQNLELPIHKLCENENFDLLILKNLILNGSNYFLCNKNCSSLLHLICKNPLVSIEALEYLLNIGIDINLQDIDGNTAFHFLASNPNVTLEMVKLFFKFSANVNQQNHIFKTPFNDLVENYWNIKKFYPIFFYLLNHGAKSFKANNCGETNLQESQSYQLTYEKFKIDYYLSHYAQSLNQDFKKLFELQERTDFQIKGVKMHKELVELRTNSKINKVYQILKKYKSDEIKSFMYWVYCDEYCNKALIQNICKEFGIYEPERKYLKKDLRNFYKRDQIYPKDFQIIAHGKYIQVHKLILQARSDLFRSLFLTVKQSIDQIIDYSRKSYDTIQALVKFLYTDELDFVLLKEDNNEELEGCLDYYQLNIHSPLKFLLNYHLHGFSLPNACLKLTGMEREKEKEISNHFQNFGKIIDISYEFRHLKNPYYLIQFFKTKDAQNALSVIKSNKYFLNSTKINIEIVKMNTTIFYSQLEKHLPLQYFYNKFKVFGDIQNIEIRNDMNQNTSAYITYYYPQDARLALHSLNYINNDNNNSSSSNSDFKYIVRLINQDLNYEPIYISIHDEIDTTKKKYWRLKNF